MFHSRRLFNPLIVPAVLLAAVMSSVAPAQQKRSEIRQFRGVTPGRTTVTELLTSKEWGQPKSQSSAPLSTTQLVYEQPPWRRVIVTARFGVVRSLDFIPPAEFARLDDLARDLKLEGLKEIASVPRSSARLGPAPGEGKLLLVFNTHAVVHVRDGGGERQVQWIRFFSPFQELLPVVVMGCSSVRRALEDVRHVVSTLGVAGAPPVAELERELADILPALDERRPAGFYVMPPPSGSPLEPVGFLPVADWDRLVAGLKRVERSGEAIEQDLWKFGTAQTTYVKRHGAWAFVASSAQALAAVPSEPTLLLDDLNLEHSLAGRVVLSRLSARDRSLLIEGLKLQIMDGAKSGPQPPGPDQLRQLEDSLDKNFSAISELGVEVSFDRTARAFVLDFDQIAPPESPQARSLAAAAAARPASAFAGMFLPNEAAGLHACYQLGDQEAEGVRTLYGQGRDALLAGVRANTALSAAQQREAERLVGELHDALASAVAAGSTLDVGASLLIHPDKPELHVIAGLAVGDGERAERALRRLVELFPPGREVAVRWDASTHRGVRFHTVTGPVTDPQARKMFGDRLTIVVGIAPDRVYAAAGSGGLESLKRAIDASAAPQEQPLPAGRLSLRVGPLIRLATDVQEGAPPHSLAAELAAVRGNDRLVAQGSYFGPGSRARLTIDEGVLRLVGHLAATEK